MGTMWNVGTPGPVTLEDFCVNLHSKRAPRLQENIWTQLLVFSSMGAGPGFCSLPHPEVFPRYFSEDTGLFHHESHLSGSEAKTPQTPLAWSSVSNNSAFGKRLNQRPPDLPHEPVSQFLFLWCSLNPWLLRTLDFSSCFCKPTFLVKVWATSRLCSLTHSPSLNSISACPTANRFLTKRQIQRHERINEHLNVCSVAHHLTEAVVS